MVNELLSSDSDKANGEESLVWVGVVESDSKGHRKWKLRPMEEKLYLFIQFSLRVSLRRVEQDVCELSVCESMWDVHVLKGIVRRLGRAGHLVYSF